MADLVTLTINGKTVQAPPGTLVIDAAKRAGIEIPAFCYYEGLSLQAACRMCLVEVEKFPKLQAGCTLPVGEGMVVRTESEQVIKARKTTLEFLLTNHPLDCPVCDKGGECELQDMVFRYGAGESRYTEIKHHVEEKQWSPVVFYDAPRCILCYRCVRICDEGMGVGALGIVNRGVLSEIAPSHGDHLECDECGACIDICPVGALTSGTYRYQTRPWEMKHVGTICTYCSNGCKTTLGVRGDKIVRGNNRDKSGINGEFLCVKGRYAFDFQEHPERLTSPMMRINGKLEEVSWSKALDAVAKKFSEVKSRGGKFGVIGSTKTSNEENYFLQKFAREGLGTSNIDHHRSGDVVTLIDALAGRTDALGTIEEAYTMKASLVVGTDLAQEQPLLAYQLRANWRHHSSNTYAVTAGHVREDAYAIGIVRAEAGKELAGVESLRAQISKEKELLIIFGASVKGDAVRKLVEFGDSLGIPVKYIALVDYSNSRGAVDMGLLPDLGPGYKPVEKAGLSLPEMLAATDLDVLWVVGANPLSRHQLASSNAFVVVQEMFLTETAKRADVLFPASSAYEKNGTVTNVTGQCQKLTAAAKTMGTKPDLEIMGLISKEMKLNLGIWSSSNVFEEIRKVVRGYNIPLPIIATGQAALTSPLNGKVPVPSRPDLIQSAGNTLFTSGSLGRYSKKLTSVLEYPARSIARRLRNIEMEFFIITGIKTALVAFVLLTLAAYLVWIERKVLAHIQLRVGPYRVGPHGLLQPLADLIKLVTKEGVMPATVNKFYYLLAPFLAVALALVSIAVIPFGKQVEVFGYKTYLELADVNLGILVILAISSVSVYAIALGGWASNNKYSLLGGLRSSAQMISYELPLSLAICSPLLLCNTLNLREVAEAQTGFYLGFIPRWHIFQMPMPQILSFIVFMIAGFAETNRIPFDLPEAENELVAGFHTEYSSTGFAAFFTAEYCNMVTISAVATHLFLGGWNPPLPAVISDWFPVVLFVPLAFIAFYHSRQTSPTRTWDRFSFPVVGVVLLGLGGIFVVPVLKDALLPVFWFASKVGAILFLFIWIRGTLPRFRYDQLMSFTWTFLFPVSILQLLLTGLAVALGS